MHSAHLDKEREDPGFPRIGNTFLDELRKRLLVGTYARWHPQRHARKVATRECRTSLDRGAPERLGKDREVVRIPVRFGIQPAARRIVFEREGERTKRAICVLWRH